MKRSGPLRLLYAFRLSTGERATRGSWSYFLPPFFLTLLGILAVLISASCARRVMPGTVKIALVAPFEGYYRATGYDAIYSARLAVREINNAGGIRGWRLELVAYDDRGEPELARRAAQSVTMDPEILVILGHYLAPTTATARAIYTEAHLPFVVLGTWTQRGPTVWHLMPSPDVMAEAMISTSGTVDGPCLVEGEGPVAQALRERVPSNTAEQSAMACVYSTMPAIQAGEWLATAHADGWDGTFIGDLQLANASFSTLAAAAVLNSAFVTPYPLPRELTDVQPWTEAYRSVGPHVPEPGIYAVPTYEAVYVVAEAIDRMLATHSSPSRAGLNDALGLVDHTGMLGRLQLGAEGYWTPMKLYRYHWTVADALPQLMSRDAP